MYVLFEGVDTCGKSTQIALLKQAHPDILTTFEPGATTLGEEIRELLLHGEAVSKRAEALLFLADRAEHYRRVVKPALAQNQTVVSDRGFISGIAYAQASGSFDLQTLIALNRFALEGRFCDKAVLFHIDEQTLRKRSDSKALDQIESRGIEYLLEVQELMFECVLALKIDHILISANKPKEEIHQTILTYLKL